MALYFAFGSNLDLGQMYQRCPTARPLDRAVARGYRLAFPLYCPTWQGGVASIEPAGGAKAVQGAVYEISESELTALDAYEDIEAGDYRRETIEAACDNLGRLVVWTYIANPDPEGPSAPSAAYRDALLRGARDHGLSEDYIAMLQSLATREEQA